MSGLAASVDWVVHSDMASGSRVAGQGIGRGTEDLAGKTLDRLIDLPDDIWTSWGDGREDEERCGW